MDGSTGSSEKFVALNALRGVAAVAVAVYHGPWSLRIYAPGGYLAVDFFFLLSGWVLAHAYDHKLRQGLEPGTFIRARLIRLYPVYLLVLTVTFAGWAAVGNAPYATGLAALFFIPNVWEGAAYWLLPQSWSLTAELMVNLPFGLLHRRLTDGVLMAVVAAAFVGLIVCAVRFGAMDAVNGSSVWPRLLSRAFFSFPLGVLLYRHRPRLAGWAPKWSAWPAVLMLILVVVIPVPATVAAVRDLGTIVLALPVLLLFASNASRRPWTTGIANAVGDMSYALYLLHAAGFAFANACLIVLAGTSLNLAGPGLSMPLVVAMMILAWCLDRYFDRPIRHALLSGVRPVAARLAVRPSR